MKNYLKPGTLALLIIFIASSLIGCQPKEVTLEVYAGNGTKAQMEEIKALYEAQNPHITIVYNFAASSSLQAAMRTLEQGDLYITGESDIENMSKDGLIINSFHIASRITSIVVREGDDIVTSWDDLAKEGVRITMPNPDLGSGGRAADKAIKNSPLSEEIHANIISFSSSPETSIELLLSNEVDAVIRPFFEAESGIAFIDIPEEIAENFHLWIAVTTFTQAKEEALAFAQFVAGAEGQQIFKETGYSIIN